MLISSPEAQEFVHANWINLFKFKPITIWMWFLFSNHHSVKLKKNKLIAQLRFRKPNYKNYNHYCLYCKRIRNLPLFNKLPFMDKLLIFEMRKNNNIGEIGKWYKSVANLWIIYHTWNCRFTMCVLTRPRVSSKWQNAALTVSFIQKMALVEAHKSSSE